MKISAVICAYTMDRIDDIREAVLSLERQTIRPCEIVLVTDHNDELFDQAKREFLRVTVVKNVLARGLSGARNTGIGVSGGDLIAFLDDDAVADPDWLFDMSRHFSDPQTLGVGSKSVPLWLGKRPRWFPDEFLWVVGCTHSGAVAGPVRNVLGGAMCVRRIVFEKAGGFSSTLGRTSSKLPVSCEETEFCMRASRCSAPGHFIYDQDAMIHHKVKTERLTFRYFLLRCLAEGISKRRLMALAPGDGNLSTERAYVRATLSRGIVAGLWDFATRLDVGGIGRAAAILTGLAAAAGGYLAAGLKLLRAHLEPHRAALITKTQKFKSSTLE